MDLEETKALLFNKVIRFISLRQRSKKEVKDYLSGKLYRKNISAADKDSIVEDIMSKLAALGLVDDTDFAKSWVENRLRSAKAKGLVRIKLELLGKGVSKEVVEELLRQEGWASLEAEAAVRLARKKAKTLRGLGSFLVKRKVLNYLLGRGFTFSSAEAAVDEILKKE